MSKLKSIFLGLVVLAASASTTQAANVAFIGTLTSGPQPSALGVFPRNFTFNLSYDESMSQSSSISGTWTLAASLPDNPTELIVPVAGAIAVVNNSAAPNANFGLDVVSLSMSILGGGAIAGANINFSFAAPGTTITTQGVTAANISAILSATPSSLILTAGGRSFRSFGSVSAAPEPSTMLALSCLVAGGCGIGYRRRRKNEAAEATAS